MDPSFPISVYFEETEEEWIFSDATEMACTLEWFDSDDPEERAIIRDSQNRPVRLKVEKLELVEFRLIDGRAK